MNFESLVGHINQVQDVLQAQAAHAVNLSANQGNYRKLQNKALKNHNFCKIRHCAVRFVHLSGCHTCTPAGRQRWRCTEMPQHDSPVGLPRLCITDDR